MSNKTLRVRYLTKRFHLNGQDILAVNRVSFDVAGTEFFTMLGPSGCGKTTTLRMIAGLEAASGGTIEFDGRDYTSYPPQRRNIGMVFQSYALFPHLTIFENVAYGLRLRGLAADDIAARVARTLGLLHLAPLADRLPADLSGGQQQRVSIAWALVYEPGMLLLDEPLANLDAKLRVLMREEIRRIQRELGILSLYVTHDQEEAMSVSDRIAVFDQGRVRQIGRPQEVYDRPASLFVADFIGKANFFRAGANGNRIGLEAGGEFVARETASLDTDESARTTKTHNAFAMLRPERLKLAASGAGIPCRITRIQHLGATTRYTAEAPGAESPLTVDAGRPAEGIAEGSTGTLTFDPADAIVFVAADRG